jgi:hypothetical protein
VEQIRTMKKITKPAVHEEYETLCDVTGKRERLLMRLIECFSYSCLLFIGLLLRVS